MNKATARKHPSITLEALADKYNCERTKTGVAQAQVTRREYIMLWRELTLTDAPVSAFVGLLNADVRRMALVALYAARVARLDATDPLTESELRKLLQRIGVHRSVSHNMIKKFCRPLFDADQLARTISCHALRKRIAAQRTEYNQLNALARKQAIGRNLLKSIDADAAALPSLEAKVYD